MGEYTLYQPIPNRQMLLDEFASSSSVCTYLKMQGIDPLIRSVTNSEFMSENGKLPVVVEKNNDKPMCGFIDVFRHVSQSKNYTPSLLELSYMHWVESEFLKAEMYICWCFDKSNRSSTFSLYTYDLPWPISDILFNRKRSQIMSTVGSHYVDFEDFLVKFKRFLEQLNKKIGTKSCCLNQQSAVDALIYGHVNAIKKTNLNQRLTNAIEDERKIMKLVDLIDKTYPS